MSHQLDLPSRRTRASGQALLLTLCLANFMATLDVFVVNVALDDIGHDLGHGVGGGALADVSWVLNAYTIVFGALVIPAGRIADRFGRKGVFLSGLAIFTLASLWCALSPGIWVLVVARCVQAAGAAILVPASLGLVLTTGPAGRTDPNVRIWAITASVAAAAGPVVGGLLTQVHWSLIFLINLPIGLIALCAAARLVPRIASDRTGHVPDPVESLLVVVAVGALSTGLVKGSDWGWGDTRTTIAWVVAALACVVFVAVNRRMATPVIDLALFGDRGFASANAAMMLAGAAMGTELLGLSLLLQQSWQWSPIATGLGLAPSALATFAASQLGPRLFPRTRPAAMAAVGCLISAIGQGVMVLALHNVDGHPYAAAVLPAWLVVGFGGGLAVPTIIATGAAVVANHASASGSAVVQTSRQLGSVIGTAVLVAVVGSAPGRTTPFLVTWTGTTALWLLAGVAIAAALRPGSRR